MLPLTPSNRPLSASKPWNLICALSLGHFLTWAGQEAFLGWGGGRTTQSQSHNHRVTHQD